LSQRIWARQEVPQEGYQEKIERLQCAVIEEKESVKWLLGLRETLERAPSGVKVITVADRESDFSKFICEAQECRALFLIRARTDRRHTWRTWRVALAQSPRSVPRPRAAIELACCR
jgi:hypothetical protein